MDEGRPHTGEEKSGPRFPSTVVKLVGEDGNAFTVLGAVGKALKRTGHADVVDEFMQEAMSGDYDHLLRTCMKWVDAR